MPRPPRQTQRRPRPTDRSGAAVPPAAAVSPWVLLRSASRHPFIYRKMIRSVDPAARRGDVVNVYDKSGGLFGRGLFNPESQIVVRMLAHGDVTIDDAFWRARMDDAVALRRRLALDDVTDAYRLVHAEGDGLSGLIVERYADWLVFEIFSAGMYDRWRMLAAHLAEALGPPRNAEASRDADARWRLLVRADAETERLERFRVEERSENPQRLIIHEHGVRYRVDPLGGHKTGFFCDQRDNRRRLAELCRDATVLDVCCYTGGFALCARKFGAAREVTGVDLDESAIALAKENANLNQCRIDLVHADAFGYLRQMRTNEREFDTVVLDPPKLALSRAGVDEALRKYYDLNGLACQVLRPGGLLVTCSCSGLVSEAAFTETVYRAAQRAGRRLQLIARSGAGGDHPVAFDCPESAYLKVLWLRVL